TGTNELVSAPSANSSRNRLGTLNAVTNASNTAVGKNCASSELRTRPVTLLAKVPPMSVSAPRRDDGTTRGAGSGPLTLVIVARRRYHQPRRVPDRTIRAALVARQRCACPPRVGARSSKGAPWAAQT